MFLHAMNRISNRNQAKQAGKRTVKKENMIEHA